MIAGLAYDHHSDFEGHTYVDLLQDTAVQVPGFETKTVPLPETEFWFWLDEMAGFDNAEDSEYDNAILLEHAPPYRLHHPLALHIACCWWRDIGRRRRIGSRSKVFNWLAHTCFEASAACYTELQTQGHSSSLIGTNTLQVS